MGIRSKNSVPCPHRLIKDAGGRRFLKGLTGKDIEIWRRVSEGLAACGADVESGEARIAEDVGRFELELSRANEEIAAEKVLENISMNKGMLVDEVSKV